MLSSNGVVAATEAITAVDTTTLAVGMYWSTNGTSSQIASQEPPIDHAHILPAFLI